MSVTPELQCFGNHLILGLSGTTLSDDDKRLLSDLKPVGVIFYGKNFRFDTRYEIWLQSFKELSDQIRQYTERNLMFITIDHEGGSVVRPPLPITRFPHSLLLEELAYDVASATALELKSLGINVSFAPVADIFSNPVNPVIGPRAFGTTPQMATQSACNYYKGLKESGIIGCAKHFPGHGDTSTDSHIELPILNLTVEKLRSREFKPFKALIDEQVPLIMTAHILFPKIDPNVPATLSQPILHNLLREELGFEGVVVSDDLDMKAVSGMFTNSGTIARAFKAGCDLFIVSRNISSASIERTIMLAQDFASSLSNGSLDQSVVKAAKARIEKILAATPQYSVHYLNRDILEQHASLAIACCFQSAALPINFT